MKILNMSAQLLGTCLVIALGSSLLVGFNLAKLNTPSKFIRAFINESYTIRNGIAYSSHTLHIIWSVIVSIYVASAAIGSLFCGWLANRIGRKKSIMANHLLVIVGGILETLSKYTRLPELIVCGRVLTGLNTGLTMGLATIYLTEISPVAIRGTVANFYQVGVVLGIMLAQFAGLSSLLGTESRWHYLCGLTCLPGLIAACLLYWCPESPRYILLKQKDEKSACAVMMRMSTNRDEQAIQSAIGDMRKEMSSSKETLGDFKASRLLTEKHLLLPLLVCLACNACQQWSGINAIFAYSNDIFLSAGIDETHVQYAILSTGIINVIMTFVNLPLMEYLGRRPLMVYPTVPILLCLYLMIPSLIYGSRMAFFSYFAVVLIMLFIMCFAVGLGPIPCMIASELFLTGPRGTAVAIIQGTNWTMNMMVMFFFTLMKEAMGPFLFIVYALICTVSLVIIYLFLPESKNRDVEDIVNDFKRGLIHIPFTRRTTFLWRNDNANVKVEQMNQVDKKWAL